MTPSPDAALIDLCDELSAVAARRWPGDKSDLASDLLAYSVWN